MDDSVSEYNGSPESDRIKESEVYEYTCLCTNSSNCTNCARPKSYLVTRWIVGLEHDPHAHDLHRFDNRSLDYVQGFIEGLNLDKRTSSVHLTEIEE